jgi:hypothetical protein
VQNFTLLSIQVVGQKKTFKFRFEKNLKKSPFFNKEIGEFMEFKKKL